MADGTVGPISGHDTKIFINDFPPVTDVYIEVGELRGDIGFNDFRNSSDGSRHGANIDTMVVSDLRHRGPSSFQIQSDTTDTSHAALKSHYNVNGKFQWNFRGPDYVVDATSDIVCMAQITKLDRVGPEDAGIYVINVEVVFSGDMKEDGVTITS